MKLVEIIRTKNGLSFLEKDTTKIRNVSNKLELEIDYDPNVDYGESTFSYKDYVRKLRKTYHTSLSGLVVTLVTNAKNETNRKMASVLYTYSINFDGDFLMYHSSTNEISYMPYNKVQKIDTLNNYAKVGRQKISIYKFIAKVFKGVTTYSEQAKKDFCEYIKSFTMNGLTVEYLEGEAIGKSYAEVPHIGWSSASCMANKECYPAKMFTIYNENCQLGIIRDGEEVVGRFLRWKTTDGEWYEDRLYYKTYPVQAWYNERCEKEKVVRYGGKTVVVDLKRPFDSYTSEEKPSYMDSLSYRSKDNKQISNKHDTFNK